MIGSADPRCPGTHVAISVTILDLLIPLSFPGVAVVVAAVIVILVGKGGGSGGGSASIVSWRFAIVRVQP